MRPYFVAVVMLMAFAGEAAAQQGRVVGIVRDERGNPIKGATIIAENADASPSSFTSSSDERGRFAIIGLKSGVWSFRAGAPSYAADGGEMTVRAGTNPAMTFTLQRLITPPSALGSLAPRDLQESLTSADALYNKQQWDEAIREYREILERSPSLNVIYLQIAGAYRGKKSYDDAIGAYNALLKLDPDNDKAKVGIAMTHVEKGDLDAAERALQSAAQSPGAAREVFYDLGEVKRARSQPDEAAKAYERATQADPAWGKPQFALGQIAMAKGDAAAARKYFQTVTEVDPVSPEAEQATNMLRQLDQGR
jgi:tetratricopeptide (TPR) repeat protein